MNEEINEEPIIIAGLELPGVNLDYAMSELKSLASANHMRVMDQLTQKLERPNAATYFGKGKIEELTQVAAAREVETLVVNDELTPSQLSNLEKETQLRVIDRTGLILEIFANRARSKEARLQVELAKLQYQLPRLRTSATQRLDQQTAGNTGGGFTNRGAGETKLELNRRTIRNRINHINQELKEMSTSANVQRQRRDKKDIPSVALVGYTNTGKSTTMNGLISMYGRNEDKQVFEKDMLFATLDTSVRKLTFPDQKELILSDTVGFVSNLPHQLVKAFRSTLSEAAKADLLVQVVDVSDPHYREMMQTTADTLQEIGVTDVPMIYAFNKADRAGIAYPTLDGTELTYSAKQLQSLEMLTSLIKKQVFKNYVRADFLIPFDEGQVVNFLNGNADVKKTSYTDQGTKITAELKDSDYQRLAQYVVQPEDRI
ncbi:GTPase HflX [Pediococcus acidilactici]|uniref:GTPase HflX n=1 Tax=Pediococcus acidilactici TaxID=1254 RepID=UPI001320624C|nr:GTPase HflX [Pediococcus acidilactici]KAF0340639.1 GTPase HflX [Pediococcus acidilactici]KAF0390571.1 GTPase HflX [Pediococcus acidilactici]KAF0453521.1 GTPase HflX [Pediococcus acidilactici]KAF0463139.1 GTPase HflX [Pediococcus acidilactici]KAF0515014.1 GTPase HflX [Pediococcus acidilactici]